MRAGATTEPAVQAKLAAGALGVVFGDIGTSPLYTVQTVFSPSGPHPVAATTESVFAIVSLIFWSVTIVVTVTYVALVMRADNDGEGGIMALIALLRRRRVPGGRRTVAALAGLGIFGASLFFGDSMITPAISVLSAVEGVKVVDPSLERLVVPVAAAIIVVLFLLQRIGTGAVGRLFGPIMVVWFLVIAACGVHGIAGHPEILRALSPTYAVAFLAGHFSVAFLALGAVVLAVTGAEALYADMGHFGRAAITRGWLALVLPACMLSYMGQGALILGHAGDAVGSPFFELVPGWGRLPMVLLATLATVIASQAVITGAYSVAHQAHGLGYLPRLRIKHTSEDVIGQIYVPWINWTLMVSVLILVLTFRTATALASAYGMAVIGTITITTLLFFYLARDRWPRARRLLVVGAAGLLTVDLLFLAANLTKLAHGAWLPLLIGVTTFTVFATWQRGRAIVTRQRERDEGTLRAFIDKLDSRRPPLLRVPGTAVFMSRSRFTAPLALHVNVERFHVLPEHVVILTVETLPAPHVPLAERLTIRDLGADDGMTHVTARFGYKDLPNVPGVLRLVEQVGLKCPIEVDEATYFLSTIELRSGDAPTMARWRKRLFLATAQVTSDAAEYFGLPRERTVTIGSRIDV